MDEFSGGKKLFDSDLTMRCKEHHWEGSPGRWVCAACGEEAAVTDLQIAPCPRCGAAPQGDLVYCRICLDELYGLDPRDD